MSWKKVTRYVFDDSPDTDTRVRRALGMLELTAANSALEAVIKEAEEKGLSYKDFLDHLIDHEVHYREDRRIERWRKKASFPRIHTIQNFDFAFPDFIEKDKILKLTSCAWIDSGTNVVFLGPPGVGKTHLAIALGIEAIAKGYETRFIAVNDLISLINDVIKKDRDIGGGEHRKKLLLQFSSIKLLILDELVYEIVSQEAVDFLFQLLRNRFDHKGSVIITSNHGFGEWDKFFAHDADKAVTVVDRLLQHCVIASIRGKSYRTAGVRIPTIIAR